MDLHCIADIATTVVGHFVMQVPVVVGRGYILWIKQLIGAIGCLADFPGACASAIVIRHDERQVLSVTDGFGSLKGTRHIGRDIHHKLASRLAVYRAAATFHHITDVVAIVSGGYIIQIKSSVGTISRW